MLVQKFALIKDVDLSPSKNRFYIYLFLHEKISICVYIYIYMRCSKVDDGADSLCAVYYHILCNYIITANHPPEVAVLCGNTLLQNKHSDLSTSHTH